MNDASRDSLQKKKQQINSIIGDSNGSRRGGVRNTELKEGGGGQVKRGGGNEGWVLGEDSDDRSEKGKENTKEYKREPASSERGGARSSSSARFMEATQTQQEDRRMVEWQTGNQAVVAITEVIPTRYSNDAAHVLIHRSSKYPTIELEIDLIHPWAPSHSDFCQAGTRRTWTNLNNQQSKLSIKSFF